MKRVFLVLLNFIFKYLLGVRSLNFIIHLILCNEIIAIYIDMIASTINNLIGIKL